MRLAGAMRGDLVVLAPSEAAIPAQLRGQGANSHRHEELLARAQKLRGKIYFEDGAIQGSQLTRDGRHRVEADRHAWHILAVNAHEEVYGCARYRAHRLPVSFHQLAVNNSVIAHCGRWGETFRTAVASDIEIARCRNVAYAEVGGWALAPDSRCTTEALRVALATYGLARILGGCVGIGTVTRRHCSSSILRRVGGRPLSANGEEVPVYFDAHYGCEMEVLRFDSNQVNPRFEEWTQELAAYLRTAQVIVTEGRTTAPAADPAPRFESSRRFAHAVPA